MIYKGNKEIEQLYIGATEMNRVMLGETVVWGGQKIIKLGTATSIDIKNTYSKYAQLTADNFFFLSAGDCSGSDHIRNGTGRLIISAGLTKSYSNGVITLYPWCNSGSAPTTMVLVTKPEKLIYLGTGQSFNVKNSFPDEYMNFTVNNFLIKTSNQYNGGTVSRYSRNYTGNWDALNYHTFTKGYNASTGVLTVYFRDQGDADDVDFWNFTSDCVVYLTKKAVV